MIVTKNNLVLVQKLIDDMKVINHGLSNGDDMKVERADLDLLMNEVQS